jgi:Immunity protein 43
MLFVAHRPRESQDKLGLPTYIHRVYTETFNEKKPMEALFNEYSRDNLNYNPKRDGVPVPANRRLPPKLVMVCKGLKKLATDFYADGPRQWVVSATFYEVLQSNHWLEGCYEVSELTVVSDKNQPISEKQYYLLRFFLNHNELIDFARSSHVASSDPPLTPETPPLLYYPELVFNKGVEVPPVLFIDQESFWYGFVCDGEAKTIWEKAQLLGFDFYTLPGYVQERLAREETRRNPPGPKPMRLT